MTVTDIPDFVFTRIYFNNSPDDLILLASQKMFPHFAFLRVKNR